MKTIIKDWKKTIFLLLLICGLAFLLRVYNLTILPVFADEAIYIRWSQVMGNEPTLRFLPLSDGKQPLFMWILMFLASRFKDPLFIGRFISVLSGIGTLLGIFASSYYLFRSQKVSLIAVLLWALSPFSLFFDRMALVDSMLTALGIWTFFFGLLTVKTLRLDFAMLSGFALGGALLTKSPALFFTILLPTLGILYPKMSLKSINLIKLGFFLFVIYVLGYGFYNILRLGPNFHLIGSRNLDYVFELSHLWTNPKDPLVSHLKETLNWFFILGPAPIIGLFFLGGIVYRQYLKELFVLYTWALFPILVQSEFAKVFTARYILFTLPYIFIISSLVFMKKEKTFRTISGLLLAFFIFFSLRNDFLFLVSPAKSILPRSERSGYLEEWTSGVGIKDVAEYIRNEVTINPDQQIIIGTEGFFGTLPDGLQMYVNDLKQVVVIGVGLGIKEINPSLLESRKAGNRTFLVVNDSRFSGEADELGLELLRSYPKAVKPNGSIESLLFYKVTSKSLE